MPNPLPRDKKRKVFDFLLLDGTLTERDKEDIIAAFERAEAQQAPQTVMEVDEVFKRDFPDLDIRGEFDRDFNFFYKGWESALANLPPQPATIIRDQAKKLAWDALDNGEEDFRDWEKPIDDILDALEGRIPAQDSEKIFDLETSLVIATKAAEEMQSLYLERAKEVANLERQHAEDVETIKGLRIDVGRFESRYEMDAQKIKVLEATVFKDRRVELLKLASSMTHEFIRNGEITLKYESIYKSTKDGVDAAMAERMGQYAKRVGELSAAIIAAIDRVSGEEKS